MFTTGNLIEVGADAVPRGRDAVGGPGVNGVRVWVRERKRGEREREGKQVTSAWPSTPQTVGCDGECGRVAFHLLARWSNRSFASTASLRTRYEMNTEYLPRERS